jgi:Alpha/beta hydrolase of unknown function (DUF900)
LKGTLKTIRSILLCGLTLAASLYFGHAQATADTGSAVITDPSTDVSNLSDLAVELKALEMATPIAASNEPAVGNFYSAQHAPGSAEEWPPLPGNIFGLPVWPLDTNIFVIDDLGFRYSESSVKTSKTANGVEAEDDFVVPSPPGGGSDTNTYNPPVLTDLMPDYGTNLFVESLSMMSGNLTGTASNTLAGVEYAIQTNSDLTTTNWADTGQFILGSDVTNWTQFILPPPLSTNNLFFRLQSQASSDGSGIPNWWELKYFGTTNGINPNAQDSAGDGYTIYQKYEMGLNPNTFYTPLAPQNVTVTYNSTTGTATITWLPSPGNVTGYTITDAEGNTYNVTGDSFTETIPYAPDYDLGSSGTPTMQNSFQVQADYSGGNSAKSPPLPLQPSTVTGSIIPAPDGGNLLAVANIPTNAANIRVFIYYAGEYPGYSGPFTIETNVDIPVAAFTNGFCPAYSNWLNLAVIPANEYVNHSLYLQSVDTNGNVSGGNPLTENWGPDNFYDGREQLKQNLTFQFRIADTTSPFTFISVTNPNSYTITEIAEVSNPMGCIYASFYDENNANGIYGTSDFGATANTAVLNIYRPFEDNVLYRNFVSTPADVDTNGVMTTGVTTEGLVYGDSSSEIQILDLQLPPTYLPTTNVVGAVPLLGPSTTQWLCTFPAMNTQVTDGEYVDEGINYDDAGDLSFSNDAVNYWGLPYQSAMVYYWNGNDNWNFENTVLNPGNSWTGAIPNAIYMNTTQPGYKTVEYDFWNDYYYGGPATAAGSTNLPGNSAFSPTNTSQLLMVSVGQSIGIAAFAKLEVTNSSYTGVYGYVQQYLTNAIQLDDSGNPTTNLTGVVSPYGNYFATQAGAAAVVTMPDPDTGQQGTCIVYSVSLQLDANHDGNMDLSWNGTDVTSTNSPFVFWANNNYDRWNYDPNDNTNYMDDVLIGSNPGTSVPEPDYNYSNALSDGYTYRAIPDTRDLQDFARLWVCGINSNLLAALPTGSTITLSWGDAANPNAANPTIDLFQAADANGGIGYLTNATIATEQTNVFHCAYIGRLGPGQSIQLNTNTFANNWAGNYFIWCGVSNGTGGLNLTIKDTNSNVLGQTTAYIQIVDIKQMYERWTVGDQLNVAPTNEASLATDNGLPLGVPAFRYTLPQDTNTPYILFVHGWNMESWEKDRFAESALKRLYWQGYQGRFGSFRWPTGNGFVDVWTIATNLTEKDNFDSSEYQAWQSGSGLLNKLDNLSAEYPGHVYLLAHSMGNIVAGEALRLAGSNQVVNAYVASQAAVSAHTYDDTVPDYSFYYPPWSVIADTPDIYGDWLVGNYGGGAGLVVNFYNTNDYALSRPIWQRDELLKPDQDVLEGSATWYYGYDGSVNDPAPWNNFYKKTLTASSYIAFDIVTNLNNRYEVMSYDAQSWTTALGATPGVLNLRRNVALPEIWPPDPTGDNYAEHFWHSAEFEGDYPQQQSYWSELLGPEAFNLQ